MPILKSGSKRRSRADLSVEMISAPLADFRHTMHIGRGGDTFGDTSFLSTKPAPANQVVEPKNGPLMRKLRGSKHSLTESASSDLASYPLQANSTASLPYVRDDHDSELYHAKGSSSTFSEMNGLGGRGLNIKKEEHSFREERERSESPAPPNGGMKNAESILSLNIDLGPSMLGDILSIMDQNERDLHTEGDSGWRLDVSHPLNNGTSSRSGLEDEKLNNTNDSKTNRSAFNAASCTTHRITDSSTIPKATRGPPPNTSYRATAPNTTHGPPPNTTYRVTAPNTTHGSPPNTSYRITAPNTTHGPPPNTTYRAMIPQTVHSATLSTTSNGKYSNVCKATPTSTHSTVYNTKPPALYNSAPCATPSTTHSSSINHDDFLFMDEDEDDEIRV